MCVYYKCLRGDSVHLALTERDSFALTDRRGRNWICYPIPRRKVENLTMAAHVSEVHQIDATASRQGLKDEGTEVRIYFCENEQELLEKLTEDS
jgi:hypothetical protein